MGFVDAQVVDACVLEGQSGVVVLVEHLLELLFGAGDVLLDLLDGEFVALFGRSLQPLSQLVQLCLDECGDVAWAEFELLEGAAGHHHGVPIVVGHASDEGASLGGGEVVTAGGEDHGPGVDLHELAGELLKHVVGHDDGRLLGHAQAFELHAADDHLGGLAGTDLMEQSHGRFGDHAGDCGALMLTRRERLGHAGEGEGVSEVAVVAQHQSVEGVVVGSQETLGTLGVLPHPFLEALTDRVGFRVGGGGLRGVQDQGAVLVLVVDDDRALGRHRHEQVQGVAALCAPGDGRRRHAAHAPLGGFPLSVRDSFESDLAGACPEQLTDEELVVLGGDPG